MAGILDQAREMLAPVARSYQKRLKAFGPEPKGVFWKSGDTQALRFEVLLGIIRTEDLKGGISIADFGCGYGALFEAVQDEPFMVGSRYDGYDMTLDMIKSCRRRIRDDRARFFHQVEVLEPVDYTFVSGTYNLKNRADPQQWETYIQASLAQLWSKTRKGLAFNILCQSASAQESGLFYADPTRLFSFCTRHLSPRVQMVAETPKGETTFKVFR
ncbi:MAG: hypothetical protein ACPGOV_07490 [Magnetovibrionaceae bacterium]